MRIHVQEKYGENHTLIQWVPTFLCVLHTRPLRAQDRATGSPDENGPCCLLGRQRGRVHDSGIHMQVCAYVRSYVSSYVLMTVCIYRRHGKLTSATRPSAGQERQTPPSPLRVGRADPAGTECCGLLRLRRRLVAESKNNPRKTQKNPCGQRGRLVAACCDQPRRQTASESFPSPRPEPGSVGPAPRRRAGLGHHTALAL